MNTIQVTTTDGIVNYTEAEVLRLIERAKELDAKHQNEIDNRHKVRDFFSECEWSDGETTITKADVNELLDAIGSFKLRTKYTANYTITGTFSVEVEEPDDAEALFVDNVTVDFYDGDIDVDLIEVLDMQVDE